MKTSRRWWIKLRTVRSVSTLVICIWAATMSAAQQVSAPAPQNGTIIGTVLDVTGQTVPGATVVLQGPAPGDSQTVVTQDNGFFKFDGVKPATPCRITVTAQGLASWSSNPLVVTPGQFLNVTGIALRPAIVQTSMTVVPADEVAVEQLHAEEKQRVFGFVPNFYVVYDHDAVPLPAKLKFELALKTLTDPVTMAGFAANAAIYQMSNYPSYQQSAKGYGERLGATFAGGYTNILVGDAILPALLHQDPRYFYQGTGTTKSRLRHALSSAFVARGDNGRSQINFSGIGGDLASGAMANAYYPSRDRGAGLVLRGALIGLGGRMVEGVVQEFVLHKFTRRGEPLSLDVSGR